MATKEIKEEEIPKTVILEMMIHVMLEKNVNIQNITYKDDQGFRFEFKHINLIDGFVFSEVEKSIFMGHLQLLTRIPPPNLEKEEIKEFILKKTVNLGKFQFPIQSIESCKIVKLKGKKKNDLSVYTFTITFKEETVNGKNFRRVFSYSVTGINKDLEKRIIDAQNKFKEIIYFYET